jgi:hypothetical protein
MRQKLLICIITLFLVSSVSAQTACPIGVPAGSPQCGPSPASHGNHQQQAAPPARHVPDGKWLLTWGAIALANNGDTGVAIGRPTKESARKASLESCRSWEGRQDCRVLLVYENQCAAMAAPFDNGVQVPGQKSVASAQTIATASEIAIEGCKKARGSGDCKAIYSDCTKPVYRKF